jgi:cytoskeletal protein CcmA (bactofilin family)
MAWLFASKTAPARPACTVVTPATVIRGDVSSSDGFHIDGMVVGSVASDGVVYIGHRGAVLGNVRAGDVIVRGRVDGDVLATGKVEVTPQGIVGGDIQAASVKLHPGATLGGCSASWEGDPPSRTPSSLPPVSIPPPSAPRRSMFPIAPSPAAASSGTFVADALRNSDELGVHVIPQPTPSEAALS